MYQYDLFDILCTRLFDVFLLNNAKTNLAQCTSKRFKTQPLCNYF